MINTLKYGTVLLAYIGLFYISSCSTSVNEKVAKNCVERFHQNLNAQQYHNLYAMTDELYRSNMTEEKSTEFFMALHNKLGKVTQKQLLNVNTDFSQNHITLTLVYTTNFEAGAYKESFIWKIDNNEGRLIRYDIDVQ